MTDNYNFFFNYNNTYQSILDKYEYFNNKYVNSIKTMDPERNSYIFKVYYKNNINEFWGVFKVLNNSHFILTKNMPSNILYEFYIGKSINLLKQYFPNFVYTFGMNIGDHNYKPTKNILELNNIQTTNLFDFNNSTNIKNNCANNLNNGLLTEYIPNSKTFEIMLSDSEFNKNIDYNLMTTLFQVYAVLYALKDVYCHQDLHMRNIVITKLPEPINIIYNVDNKEYILITRYIPVIIDYSSNYINLDKAQNSNNFIKLICKSLYNTNTDMCNLTKYAINNNDKVNLENKKSHIRLNKSNDICLINQVVFEKNEQNVPLLNDCFFKNEYKKIFNYNTSKEWFKEKWANNKIRTVVSEYIAPITGDPFPDTIRYTSDVLTKFLIPLYNKYYSKEINPTYSKLNIDCKYGGSKFTYTEPIQDMFELEQWNNHLLHFKNKPIKILEIGIDKGINLQKFIKIFLESNEESEYYGIDAFDKSNENKKNVNEIINNSIRKNNIHLINKESIIALQDLTNNNILFDIIYINSLYINKNILSDSIMAIKLLNINGIIIFDDYILPIIDSNILNPFNLINELLNLHINELEIIYIGYQIILKKIFIKNNILEIDNIINKFNILLDNYWNSNNIKKFGILLHLEKLPNIKPIYDDSNNIKLKELKGIEIFKHLNIEDLMYKYTSLKNTINEFKYKLKYNEVYRVNNKFIKLNYIITYDKYKLFNIIQKSELYNYKYLQKIYKTTTFISDYDLRNNKKYLNIYNKDHEFNIINILDVINNNTKIKSLFNTIKNNNIKTDHITIIHIIKHMDLSKMYNNILLQVLTSKYTLKNNGTLSIYIEIRYDFINDLLLLLNYIFMKVEIYITSNKIGRLTIRIEALEFLGIDDNLFNKIYEIVTNTDKEIISIFNKQTIYINIDSIENNIFEQTKKIINYITKYQDTIKNNIYKCNISLTKRTINDINEFFQKIILNL